MSATGLMTEPGPGLRRRAGRLVGAATESGPAGASSRACPLCATVAESAGASVVTCGTCELVYRRADEPVGAEAYWSAYVEDATEQAYDARRQAFFGAYWRRLRRLVSVRDVRPSVLDVGCVPGQLLREAIADGWDAHGVELSEALSVLTRRSSGARVWTGRIEEIDFRGRQFDLIVLSNTFRHLERPLPALRRCAAALRPRGIVVVREMQASHPQHAARLAEPYPFDMQFVTPATLRTFMRQAGLKDVGVFNSPVSLLTVRGLSRLGLQAPPLLGAMRHLVNLAIRCADPFTAGRGVPITPSFIMAGSKRSEGAGGADSPRADTDRRKQCG